MLRKWLLAPAVGLVMALCILGGTVAGTGVKATASIFDKFYETYWQEDGPEDGSLRFIVIISGGLLGGNQFLQLKCFVNISLYLQLAHKNSCNWI